MSIYPLPNIRQNKLQSELIAKKALAMCEGCGVEIPDEFRAGIESLSQGNNRLR